MGHMYELLTERMLVIYSDVWAWISGESRKLNTISLWPQHPIFLSARLSADLYLSVCPSLCLSVCPLALYPSLCQSVFLCFSVPLCLCLRICLSLTLTHAPLPPLQFLTISHNDKTLRLKLPSFILKTRLTDISKHRSQKPYMELYFTFRGEQVGPLSLKHRHLFCRLFVS